MNNASTTDIKKAKARLLARLGELAKISGTSDGSRRPVELDQTRVGRLSRMDALQDQAMALEVENRRKQEIRRVEAALERIDSGDYGFCMSCGEDIEVKRLEIDPATPLCLSCAGGGG